MLQIITENPAYYKILDAEFPNRYGDYLESLLKKAQLANYIVTCGENSLESSDLSVIVTLGRTPTGLLLELKKTFKLKEYVGKTFLKGQTKIIPWYSLEYLLLKGKQLEIQTVELLRNLK